MARTPSNMIELGSKAPDFKLVNTIDNKLISSNDFYNKEGVLIMFICNHCPFVIHVIDEIVRISVKNMKIIFHLLLFQVMMLKTTQMIHQS